MFCKFGQACNDYSKYVYLMPDKEEKSNHVEKISAEDLQKAFDLGVRLIKSQLIFKSD